MTWDKNDKSMDVLQNIESELVQIYNRANELTDAMVLVALAKGRAAIKQKYGFGRGLNSCPDSKHEASIIDRIVEIGVERIGKVNSLSLQEYENCIVKISRSVDTHRMHGVRGYYDFVKRFVG